MIRGYITDHWRGTQGLAWSFWINLVLIRALVFISQDMLAPEKDQHYQDQSGVILALVIVLHGILFIWQAVGVIRASEIHTRDVGAMASVWAAQLGVILAFLWVIVYVQGAWHMTLIPPEDPLLQYATERSGKYEIALNDDGDTLHLKGTLELGIVDALQVQLDAHPDVQDIVLTSLGGNIYQARGLSQIIGQHGLNTVIATECSSACTTVFIGGIERQLRDGAKLGFHQYRIDAPYAVLHADPQKEQARDRVLFQRAGVSDAFIDKMFASDASQMWYPTVPELIAAGVVTINPL